MTDQGTSEETNQGVNQVTTQGSEQRATQETEFGSDYIDVKLTDESGSDYSEGAEGNIQPSEAEADTEKVCLCISYQCIDI